MKDNENKGAEFKVGDRVSGSTLGGSRVVGELTLLPKYLPDSANIKGALGGGPSVHQYGVLRDSLRHEPAEQKTVTASSHDWNVASDICRRCGITGHEYHQRGMPLCRGAEQKAWEPSVGDEIEWNGSCGRERGVVTKLFPSTNEVRCRRTFSEKGVTCDATLEVNSNIRLAIPLPASTPPAREEQPKPPEPVRCDPYAEHQRSLGESVCLRDEAGIAAMTALDPANKRARLQREAREQLDRPLPVRTGPLRDRDEFGQRVALHGWSEDAEYEGQV